MKYRNTMKGIALALTIALAMPYGMTTIALAAETAETSAPQTSAPETSAPQTSAPETSAPQTSAPETSAPDTSAPETSAPDTSGSETGSSEPDSSAESSESTSESDTSGETGSTETTESESESETVKETEKETDKKNQQYETETVEEPIEDDTLSEEEVANVNRMIYNQEIPVDGIPTFITQEMISNALKYQDQYGYPASVALAQIMQEAGFGKYGEGGSDKEGLTYEAYEYCNIFGIKDKDDVYVHYNTYSDAFAARQTIMMKSKTWLQNTDTSDDFALCLGRVWAPDSDYGDKLISYMEKYDLYRFDTLTLKDFSDMIGTFANPCPGSHVTSGFGNRKAPIAGATTYHKGIDMATGGLNIPTYAAADGTVIYVGYNSSCGNMIVIDNGNGLVTKYFHHARVYVEEGQQVIKGQQIGLAGTTGNSTGIHLHFQVEVDGTAVSPWTYLSQEGNGKRVEVRKKVEKTEDSVAVEKAKARIEAKEKKVEAVKKERVQTVTQTQTVLTQLQLINRLMGF